MLPEDMHRLGRRSGLLPLDTPVGDLAHIGVREIKLCPKTCVVVVAPRVHA